MALIPGPPGRSDQPLVTVVIPCRDEEAHIEGCVRSALTQDWPHDRLEILVADGMSMDATREILSRLAAEDSRIRLLDNTARVPAGGLNECIRRARGAYIVRMDVHADYAPDFVRKCVAVLERTGADNVGGPAKPKGTTFFQRCVAAALASPLGVAGSRYPSEDNEGWVEGVWPGAFRREVFERVGLFDPNALSSEDIELDRRIADAGGRAYSSPEIGLNYHPRGSVRALARQYFRYGQGRARTLLKHRGSASWGPAMPFLWLLGEAALVATSRWQPLAKWSLGAYALATGAEAVRVGRQEGPLAVPVVWAIFPLVHVAQGAGFATGLVRYVVRPDWSPGERLTPTEAPGVEAAAP
ncbi:MAG TPA: glycosyltransferase family 2 protein [Polyangiaceae bacterium]|jgi:cellulose synthase/poly-beta-1,6-N-acetylglucosamine synthase-like glycosyltransferase